MSGGWASQRQRPGGEAKQRRPAQASRSLPPRFNGLLGRGGGAWSPDRDQGVADLVECSEVR
jgi:hypothetical protein